MNIILVSHKIVADTIEAIINSAENLSLLATINTVKPDFVDRIIDYEPDIVILMRGVPFRTKQSLEDIITALREDAPDVRIIYVYGEVADREDYDQVAGFLVENGVFDVVTGKTNARGFLDLLVHPMTKEYAMQRKENPILKADEVEEGEADVKSVVKIMGVNRGLGMSRGVISSMLPSNIIDSASDTNAQQDIPNSDNLIIGVAQLFHRSGSTHAALEIATMLEMYENSACVLVDDRETYDALIAVKDKGCIDIFNYNELERVLGEYTYIVCDYGVLDDKRRQELARCGVKIMLCSAADWDIEQLREFITMCGELNTSDVDYCFFPISRAKFVRLNKHFSKNRYRAYRLKVSNDWNLPCDDNCAVYVDIIKRYADIDDKDKSSP